MSTWGDKTTQGAGSMLSDMERLKAAGFGLHLLYPMAKNPMAGKGWSELPLAPLEDLKGKFRAEAAKGGPGPNLGVRLGEWSQVGGLYMHVIDMDVRYPETVDEAKAALRHFLPNFEELPTVISGSGGESRHFYFLTDRPFGTKKLAHSTEKFVGEDGKAHWIWELELCGTGKQVVIPPSIHPVTGAFYSWEREFDFDMVDLGLGPVIESSVVAQWAPAARDKAEGEPDLLDLVVQPPMGLTVDEARDIIAALPKNDWIEDRDGWLRMGMALHHEFGGSVQGFNLWCEVSRGSDKFDSDDQRRVWDSFKPQAVPLTMATLKREYRENGGEFLGVKTKIAAARNYQEAVAVVSKSDLTSAQLDTVLDQVLELAKKDGLNPKKSSVKKDIDDARREVADGKRIVMSLEDWLAKETIRLFYNDGEHLKVVNGLAWIYDNGVWRPTDKATIAQAAYRLVVTVLRGSRDIQDGLRKMLQASDRADSMNALSNAVAGVVEKICAVDSQTDPLKLRSPLTTSAINCKNGTIWFEDGSASFMPHDPNDLFTTQIETVFDRNATCPLWDKTIAEIFANDPDPEATIRHLHEVMGYIIQTSRSHAAWFLFLGKGSNGKSLVTDVLRYLMGTTASVNKELGDLGQHKSAHAEAGLVGKLLLVDDDFKKGQLLPDGILKKLSEQKLLTANPKFAGEFNFVSRVVPLILSNSWPRTSDSSYGMTRRALVFHFTRIFAEHEKDIGLLNKILRTELPGILNHLVAGWRRLQERGHFLPSASCNEAKDDWLGKRNAFSAFMKESIGVTGDMEDKVKGADLWAAFQVWVQQDNSGGKWGKNTFFDELEAMPGISRYAPGNVITFRGLKLLAVDNKAKAKSYFDEVAKPAEPKKVESAKVDDLEDFIG